jgi:hypothetical protein
MSAVRRLEPDIKDDKRLMRERAKGIKGSV